MEAYYKRKVETMPRIGMALMFTLLGRLLSAQDAPQHDTLLASPSEYEGWKRYHLYCDRCHGQDAMGTTFAPDLRRSIAADGLVTREIFVQVVRDGRAANGMPAFGTLLRDEQIAQIYDYVKARSDGRLVRGRPHRPTAP